MRGVTDDTMALFSGNANRALAHEIARHLGVPLGEAEVGKFSDGEVAVELIDNVRGRDVFIVQSTCPPVNDHLMELLVLVDAWRRASPRWCRTSVIRARTGGRGRRARRSRRSWWQT